MTGVLGCALSSISTTSRFEDYQENIVNWSRQLYACRASALGYRAVYWYRGGEEAWAAAHLPAEDRRNP